jgi:cobaltochelatase CobN
MAATVDNLFAFDATTALIDDHQYALLADAYLLDPDTRALCAAQPCCPARHDRAPARSPAARPVASAGRVPRSVENLLLDIEEDS